MCENKDFSSVWMTFEETKILEFNQYQKSDKAPWTIHADLDLLIEKVDEIKNSLEILTTTKVVEHIPCGYSLSTIWTLYGHLIVSNIRMIYTEVKNVWKSFLNP